MPDPNEIDMQAYESAPSLLGQASQALDIGLQPAAAAEGSSSTSAAEQDFSFGDLGLDASTQLLEAILAELRTLNQNIRDMT